MTVICVEWLVLLVLAILLAKWGSAWIESLYWQQRAILSYPERVGKEPGRRQAFLAGGFFPAALFLSLAGVPLETLAAKLLLVWFLLLTICTDWEQEVVFDRMLLPMLFLALPFFFLEEWSLGNRLFAAAAGGGVLFLLALFTGGIGGGDVKLVFVLGLWLGTERLLGVLCGGAILGGLAAGILLLARIRKRGDFFAYSPYFSLTAIFLLLCDV